MTDWSKNLSWLHQKQPAVPVVVFRKLDVIERLAPPRLRTNAASVEGTTPTAERLRAPLPEPQRNPVRTLNNFQTIWDVLFEDTAHSSRTPSSHSDHRKVWLGHLYSILLSATENTSSMKIIASASLHSAHLFEKMRGMTAQNNCCMSSGRMKWKATSDWWFGLTVSRQGRGS